MTEAGFRLCAGLAILLLWLALPPCAPAEVAQGGNVRVDFTGALAPKRLPRHGAAAVSVSLGGQISTLDGADPPPLQRIEVAINRAGHLDPAALPACRVEQVQPATTAGAMQACGRSLVGTGSFSAAVAIPGQAPYPSQGKLTAFNGTVGGRPAILLHVYGTQPIPTSLTVPLRIARAKGTFGTVLSGDLPTVQADVGFVRGITLRLDGATGGPSGRRFLSAGCPAPAGFSAVPFSLMRASFVFSGGPTVSETLTRTCKARG